MQEKYCKFIGVGSEGIETLLEFKEKIEKNCSLEEITLNQDIDKESVRNILDGVEILLIAFNSEDKRESDIVKAISFMATEKRILCIGFDLSLKENKEDMGLNHVIKLNKYNFATVGDMINMMIEAVDEATFLAIDFYDLKEIFENGKAVKYSLERFKKDASIDEVAKTLVEETYTTVGDAVNKKAVVLFEMPKGLVEEELLYINDITMKISEILGDTYDIIYSVNSVDSNKDTYKVCLLSK